LLVRWFEQLNGEFDKVVANEEHAQLMRSVDDLRVNLYLVERDTQILKDKIPDTRPDEEKRNELGSRADALLTALEKIGTLVRAIGADIRLKDEGIPVEYALTAQPMRNKPTDLNYIEEAIRHYGPWDAKDFLQRCCWWANTLNFGFGAG
jgi:hypothetical protein